MLIGGEGGWVSMLRAGGSWMRDVRGVVSCPWRWMWSSISPDMSDERSLRDSSSSRRKESVVVVGIDEPLPLLWKVPS